MRNKEQIRGKIAVIGRGKTQFTHKAQIAVDAGAIGVIFVNTKKRLFDAIGDADGINIPVVTVGLLAREHLTDGAVCSSHQIDHDRAYVCDIASACDNLLFIYSRDTSWCLSMASLSLRQSNNIAHAHALTRLITHAGACA